MLNDPTIPTKSVENAYKWWYLRENGEYTCTNGSERTYYKSIT